MCVDRRCQAIMEKFLFLYCAADEVHGLHHASRGQNTQHCVEVRIVLANRLVQWFGQFFATRCVDVEAKMLASLDEWLKVGLWRLWMPTKHSKFREFTFNLLSHRNVCQQHELLNHRIGFTHFLHFHFDRILCFAIHLESNFRWSQDQSTKQTQISDFSKNRTASREIETKKKQKRLPHPFSVRLFFRIFASRFKPLSDSAISCCCVSSSMMSCASSYVMAFFDLIMLLWYFVLMILAFSSISHTHEKANRSSPPRSEQRFELSNSVE